MAIARFQSKASHRTYKRPLIPLPALCLTTSALVASSTQREIAHACKSDSPADGITLEE